MFDCFRLDGLEINKVIAVRIIRGEGTEDDMCRPVKQYWDMDGNFLFEINPCEKEKE